LPGWRYYSLSASAASLKSWAPSGKGIKTMNERRKPSDHDIIMAVIGSMRGFGYLLYGALALCLMGIVGVGIFTGKWELAIVTALIAAVSGGANAAGGFMAGVLSQSVAKNPQTPMPVTTEGQPPLKTEDVSDSTGPGGQASTTPATTEAEAAPNNEDF
jgi:hypothetical protein